MEDAGRIIVEHGSGCGESDLDGEEEIVTLDGKMSLPRYADRGTVILNGWYVEYLDEDHHVRSFAATIGQIKVFGDQLTWKAKGWLSDENFDDGYRWCYYYTAMAWNSAEFDAFADHNDNYMSAIDSSVLAFPNEESALVTLNPHIMNAAFAEKRAAVVLPRGYTFGWNNYKDHHILQIAYNLDHTETYIEKGQGGATVSRVDQGYVSWITQGIIKDDDSKHDFWFGETVTAISGDDVGVIHPPFTIRPREDEGWGCMGGSHNQVTTETVEVENVPFEYAIPILTGWEMYYVCTDHEVLQAGTWIQDFEYRRNPNAATGSLTYKVSSILVDDGGSEYFSGHRVTILGLVPRGVPAPDLTPVAPPDAAMYCKRDNLGRLLVSVKNQGTLVSAPATATIIFGNGSSVDVALPAIKAGDTVTLQSVSIPPGCFSPNCGFRIFVDSRQNIEELDEGNNIAEGRCQG